MGIEQTHHLDGPPVQRPTLIEVGAPPMIGLFLRSSSPHPVHDLLEESAAARVPLLRTAPRGGALDPSTCSRTLDTASQAPGDLNANALPPMSRSGHAPPAPGFVKFRGAGPARPEMCGLHLWPQG